MLRNLTDCRCKPCCNRLLSSATVNSSTEVTEPVDYWSERSLQADVSVSCVARPAGNTAASPYWFQPITVDSLVWCDHNGQNEAARLRLRVEYGQVWNLGYGDGASSQPLATHVVSCRSDGGGGDFALRFGYPPSVPDAVELLIYLECVKADGTVSQSCQITRLPPVYLAGAMRGDALTFTTLSVRWDVALVDDQMYVSAYIAKNAPGLYSAAYADQSETLAFPHHTFQPEPIAGGAQYNRHATKTFQQSSLATVSSQWVAKRKAIAKSPCVPANVSPYCAEGEHEADQASWPWKHAGDCTSWRRTGGIIGAPCSSQKTALQLTIPRADPDWGIGPKAFGMLVDGQYELTAARPAGSGQLANSLFWFSGSPSKSWTGGMTYTLQAIEISAALTLNAPGVQSSRAPCVDADWTAQVLFVVSCVIDGTRITYGFSGSGGLNFLGGAQVSFVPYGNFIGVIGFKPQLGLWPFYSRGDGLPPGEGSIVGFGSTGDGDVPPPFTMRLV